MRATIVGTPFCRQMLTLIFRVSGYELSGRESTGDIDAVVMPPKQEITVEEEISDIAMDPNCALDRFYRHAVPRHGAASREKLGADQIPFDFAMVNEVRIKFHGGSS